ncbi:NAD(P)H dehydrogenase assembly family protein [Synechococcus sp. GFB01]|uniref:NAD(P)H dehydrogenase assembly family protein n=1 Tax=Synechococcus sp. GFB01 TaxID=1662190 RepID=UPI000A795353|nr:NAD(P)H dehydrogenase assembly family protein [Synechococcus sp. GFB01]
MADLGPDTPADDSSWALGSRVRLQRPVRYLKSADPMPMLRPPDLIDPEEVGEVVGLRAQSRVAVRFRRGSFLIDAADLAAAPAD